MAGIIDQRNDSYVSVFAKEFIPNASFERQEPTKCSAEQSNSSTPVQTPTKSEVGSPEGSRSDLLGELYERAQVLKPVGKGAFGTVYKAVTATEQFVAIKKVFQDPKYQNRELEIWQLLSAHDHPNLMNLKHHFFVQEGVKVFLHLVMDYFPIDLGRLIERYAQSGRRLSTAYTKLYMYQLARGLCFLHSCGVAHRDLKPQNIMVDPQHNVLRICDMGSAKLVKPGQPSLAYICSRFYRAPELLFGSTHYGTQVDVWSSGCILAEIMIGHSLFRGASTSDQLVDIVSLRGTPTREQIEAMNLSCPMQLPFHNVKPTPLIRVFGSSANPEAMDLLDRTLQYSPTDRLRPAQIMQHSYFDALYTTCTENARCPALYDFTEQELNSPDGSILLEITHRAAQSDSDTPVSME